MKERILKLRKHLFPENLLLCGFRGSVAHNTYIPNTDPTSIDDIDLISTYFAPVEHYLGLGRAKDHRRGNQTTYEEYDCVTYEIRHFINLLLKSNPTTLLLLWLHEDHYIIKTDFGQRLIDNRDLFSSKLLYKSFTRYAEDQLDRMVPRVYEGYMGAKRKALVDRFGYDCKNASHSLRLLKMAAEFLDHGELRVYRTGDATMLKQIKTGMWSYEDIKSRALSELDNVKSALRHSKLPEEPDEKKVEEMLMQILGDHIYEVYYAKKHS